MAEIKNVFDYEGIKIVDNKIQLFAETMQEELDNNSHKGDWESFVNRDDIMSELYYHLDKLECARVTNADSNLIKEYIADCANILMFLGNSFKLYDK